MKSVNAVMPLLIFVVIPVLVMGRLGWIDMAIVLELLAHLLAMLLIVAVIKKPWDLYYEARRVLDDFQSAQERGIPVELPAQKRSEVEALSRGFLRLCLSLHFGSAALLALAAWVLESRVGYSYAALSLLSILVRPLYAYVSFQMERLRALRGELRFPRDDVLTLRSTVEDQGHRIQSLEMELSSLRQGADAYQQRTETRLAIAEEKQASQSIEFNQKVDKVCREFERSLEQLTQDQELLRGIRAFVRLIKNTE